MSFQPADGSAAEVPQGASMMPEAAVEAVADVCHRDHALVPIEGGYDTDDLIGSDTRLCLELVVTQAGIGISRLNDPVQDILPIVPYV